MSTHSRPARIPRAMAAALTVAVAVITVAGTAGAAHAAPGQQIDPFAPDFGPNVAVVSPDTPLDEVQAMLDDLAAAQVDAEMSTARHSVLFLPGDVRHRCGSPPGPRRLLHRDRRPRRVARGRRHHRQARGLQPLPRRRRHEQLPRTRELLAHDLEPLAARELPGQDGCRSLGELLGGVAGGVDAPPRRLGRQPVADGLLHRRPAVRERRLHRRLAPAVRHQRIAAAVAHPQQRSSAAGRTRSGTRSSRAWRALRTTRPSRTRRTRRSTRRP